MASKISKYFSQADLDRIAAAVKEAELHTSGEIVPYFVLHSDAYDEAIWRGAVFFSSLVLIVFAAVHAFTETWLPLGVPEVVFITLSASVLGSFLVYIVPALKRFFSGRHLMDHRVSQRASQAFLSEEVFNTRNRTGILIFLSFFERKVVVLGDSGINAKVQRSNWDGVVKIVVGGMKSGKPADGLVDAIRQCALLLQQHGVAIGPDDKDELRDDLRTRDQ